MKKATAWMLCLFLVFSVLAVGLAGEAEVAGEEEFIVPNIVPAKEIEDFIGEWDFCWMVYEDGAVNRLPEAQPDDPANMIISEDKVLLYAAGDSLGSVKPEFIPEDGSMRMIREDGTATTSLHLTDNGMIAFTIPASSSVPDGYTIYMIQKEQQNESA